MPGGISAAIKSRHHSTSLPARRTHLSGDIVARGSSLFDGDGHRKMRQNRSGLSHDPQCETGRALVLPLRCLGFMRRVYSGRSKRLIFPLMGVSTACSGGSIPATTRPAVDSSSLLRTGSAVRPVRGPCFSRRAFRRTRNRPETNRLASQARRSLD
jgi:hypothetical protein